MNEDDLPGAVSMRMRVFLARFPVGCPARVPDTHRAREGLLIDDLLKVVQLPDSAAHLDRAFADNRDTRRIVAEGM